MWIDSTKPLEGFLVSSSIILPRVMRVGAGASKELADVLASINCTQVLIITDKVMVELGYVESIIDGLSASNIEFDVFDGTVPEPTVASIQAGVEMASERAYDCLVAIGGGSPIDSAKAIGVLAKLGGEMRDYKVPRVVNEVSLPIIAIPTTSGTGSEATRFTVITDEVSDEKMLCVGEAFMPYAALVDYELTLSLPPRTTADTGIDALTHAMEAYVSRKSNPYSDSQAITAMQLIAPNLRTVYQDGQNRQAREKVMLGATLAGIAFSNASVALVHGMSRPIGAFFHVPHGLSNAMLLPKVTEFSISGAPLRFADCAVAMGVAKPADEVEIANNSLLRELVQLNKDLQVPSPAEFGIEKQEFDAVTSLMAEQALASGSPSNNPRVPSVAEMVNIYRSLW